MHREELCRLQVRDIQSRQGVMHFRVKGKRGKVRFVPVDVMAQRPIEEYLALASHGNDTGPVFRPVQLAQQGDQEIGEDPFIVQKLKQSGQLAAG